MQLVSQNESSRLGSPHQQAKKRLGSIEARELLVALGGVWFIEIKF
jgi:hypothetical protein